MPARERQCETGLYAEWAWGRRIARHGADSITTMELTIHTGEVVAHLPLTTIKPVDQNQEPVMEGISQQPYRSAYLLLQNVPTPQCTRPA
jgi:hypothetical protein